MENLHIQPSEIDAMQFWDYELTLEEYQKILKERKEEQDAQQEGNGNMDMSKMSSNMMRQAQSNMKMPSMPSFSMPSMPHL